MENDVVTVREYPSAAVMATTIIVGVVFSVGAYLVNLGADLIKKKLKEELLANDNSASNNQTEQSPTISGASNQLASGKSIPLILGKTMMTPYVIGQWYTTIGGTDGEEVYFHCLYLLGYKDIQVKNIALGIYEIASNSAGVENGIITVDGTYYKAEKYGIQLELKQNNTEVSLYDTKVIEEDNNVELVKNSSGMLETYGFSAKFPYKCQIEIQLNGLTGFTDKGNPKDATVKVGIQMSIDGGNTWIPFAAVTGCTSSEIKNITIEEETSQMYESTFTKKKNKVMRFVAERIFTWEEINTINGTFVYMEDGVLKHGIKNNIVEFRVFRTNNKSDDSNVCDTVIYSKTRTWCYDPVKSNLEEDIVPQTPLIEKYRDITARLGFVVKAGESINGTLNKLNCICTSKARTWDSVNKKWSTSLSVTENPASLALLALTGDFRQNDKFEIDDTGTKPVCEKIDLDSFGEFYEWCDEQVVLGDTTKTRFTCDGAVVKKTTTLDIVNNILSCGRGGLGHNGNKYAVVIDKPQSTPVYILNNQKILSFTASKNFDDNIDGYYVKYISALNDYQEDTLLAVPNDIAEDLQDGTKTEADLILGNIECLYTTDPYRAKAFGLYQLALKKLRPETWSIKIAQDGNLIEVGQKIEIQSDVISVGIGEGAEITELVYDDNDDPTQIVGIETDGQFKVEDTTKEYAVKIFVADGINEPVIITKKVDCDLSKVYHNLVFVSPISLQEDTLPEVGNIVSFGIYQLESLEALAVSKRKNGDGTFDFTFVPYQDGVYTADSGMVADYVSKITPPIETGTIVNDGFEPVSKGDVVQIIGFTKDTTQPNLPINVEAVAYKDYIALKWDVNNTTLDVDTVIEISRNGGTDWYVAHQVNANNWVYYFDRSVDGYPEKDLQSQNTLANYRFRLKNVSMFGVESTYSSVITPNTTNYKTWKYPQISINTEVLDRTIMLTPVYNGEVYGDTRINLRIKRLGNTDIFSGQITFNDLLGITPDADYHTPSFTKRIEYDSTHNYEDNYRDDTTTAFVTLDKKISHTLPLIGQTDRLFDEDNNWSGSYTFEATEVSTIPANPEEDDVILFTGTQTGFVTGAYYWYTNSEWVRCNSKRLIVPTAYQYEIVLSNESGNTSTTEEISVRALCTNIADIVHSHEYYKDLYVEKLSAISANIGMISQGGMGSFDLNKGNYWALSDLSAEDSGIDDGIKKGAFRVGGENEYFKVTPVGNDNFKIELKAGNIELTSTSGSDSSQLDFTNGTYIYNNERTKRLKLSPDGVSVQIYSGEDIDWSDATKIETISRVFTDKNGNMIITNSEDIPKIGYTVSGSVYHFDTTPDEDESGVNTNNIICTGEIVENEELNPILSSEENPKCFKGVIKKSVLGFNKMVFLSKSDKITFDATTEFIGIDGSKSPLNSIWNDFMEQTSNIDATKTIGERFGLSQQQIEQGLFY